MMGSDRRYRLSRVSAATLQALAEEEFVRVFATAVADRSQIREGDLLIENRIRRGTPAEAMDMLFAELARRRIDPLVIAQHVTANAHAGRSFLSTLMWPTEWKKYEKQAAHAILALARANKARFHRVEFDARVRGLVSGQVRQVDLLLSQEDPRHVVAFEFRNYPQRLVSIGAVEELATKVKDVGANRGAVLTPRGYQRGAVKTAKYYGIVLYRFRKVLGRELRVASREGIVDTEVYWLLEHDDDPPLIFEEMKEPQGRGRT